MAVNVSVTIQQYQQLYRKLYRREPGEVRDLGSGWVLVNGARMRVTELEKLTEQMRREYRLVVARKRSIVERLLAWFRES